jgi:hypothetical protein
VKGPSGLGGHDAVWLVAGVQKRDYLLAPVAVRSRAIGDGLVEGAFQDAGGKLSRVRRKQFCSRGLQARRGKLERSKSSVRIEAAEKLLVEPFEVEYARQRRARGRPRKRGRRVWNASAAMGQARRR